MIDLHSAFRVNQFMCWNFSEGDETRIILKVLFEQLFNS